MVVERNEISQDNEVARPNEAPRNAVALKVGDHFRADLDKYFRVLLGSPTPPWRQRLRLFVSHAGLHCVAAYRFDRFTFGLRKRRKLLGWGLSVPAVALRMAVETVHHVGIGAEVGPGFFIGHAGNIYIGPTRIGSNFSCTHNVTIGVGHARGERGIPTVGDDVWVGTGSVLAGSIRVGNRATITHGTMLTRDVPDGALVGGNPGRVIMKGYDNRGLLGEREVTPLRRGADAEAVP